MNEVIQAAAELQAVCESHGWQFCFIDGLALQRWGEPRETVDADLSLFAGFGDEQQFVEPLLRHFEARIPDAAVDVERIIVRQTGELDWDYIRNQLQPLVELKDAPEILDQLESRRIEFER